MFLLFFALAVLTFRTLFGTYLNKRTKVGIFFLRHPRSFVLLSEDNHCFLRHGLKMKNFKKKREMMLNWRMFVEELQGPALVTGCLPLPKDRRFQDFM